MVYTTYRDGFVWTDWDTYITVLPNGPFEVDGIRYASGCPSTLVPRRMIELISDEGGSEGVPHYVSSPLTDDEVEHWVRHGHLHRVEHPCYRRP